MVKADNLQSMFHEIFFNLPAQRSPCCQIQDALSLAFFFGGNASSNGWMRSRGSGKTMVDELPLLDMSARVCR